MAARTTQNAAASLGLGRWLRGLREKENLPLWKVAHAAEMDSTHLSKIELGQRLPTTEQAAALAKFFGVDADVLESMRIAEKFLSDNGHNPQAAVLALTRIRETAGEYFVKRTRATASKRRKL
jgi:transcriptional regulator with XRE-family HTH domain